MSGKSSIHGFESQAKEFSQKPLSLDDLLLPHSGDTYLAEMNSNDMSDTGIYKRDILVVNASLTPADNDIIVCVLNGETLCCALNRTKAIISQNSMIRKISPQDSFTVLGVVSSSIRCFRPISLFDKKQT